MKNLIKDLYVKIFSKKQFYRINNYIINISLKARGYNNYENSYQSYNLFFAVNTCRNYICLKYSFTNTTRNN